jgi:alpha-ketoglutarate-dependent taurine dioxygenase
MMSTHQVASRIPYGRLDDDKLRQLLQRHGYVYLDDVPSGFDHVRFLRRLGAFVPQHDGKEIWIVRPDARLATIYPSSTSEPLQPHTEGYDVDGVPPKYVALWCLAPARDGGGQTTLADGYAFVDSLTRSERHELTRRMYRFLPSTNVGGARPEHVASHAVLQTRPDRAPVLRFSCQRVCHDDDLFYMGIRKRLVDFFDDTHVSVEFAKYSLLLWDNHRMLHSRTGFQDPDRHLLRVWLAEGPANASCIGAGA